MSKNLLGNSRFIKNNVELPQLIGITEDQYLEYKDLQQRIDKAIEYIENKSCELNCCFSDGDWHLTTVNKLLTILKGENNE